MCKPMGSNQKGGGGSERIGVAKERARQRRNTHSHRAKPEHVGACTTAPSSPRFPLHLNVGWGQVLWKNCPCSHAERPCPLLVLGNKSHHLPLVGCNRRAITRRTRRTRRTTTSSTSVGVGMKNLCNSSNARELEHGQRTSANEKKVEKRKVHVLRHGVIEPGRNAAHALEKEVVLLPTNPQYLQAGVLEHNCRHRSMTRATQHTYQQKKKTINDNACKLTRIFYADTQVRASASQPVPAGGEC